MPDPLAVRLMQEFKDRLLAREDDLMRRMAAEWMRIEERLRDEFELLAYEASEAKRNGEPVNEQTLYQLERYQKLLYQARAETSQYVNWANEEIAAAQEQAAREALDDAVQVLKAIQSEYGMTGVAFNILPIDALEAMIGMVGDGTPLLSWLQRTVNPEAVRGMIDALIQGIAIGLNPKKVAELMAEKFGLGLSRALNTARTETLRAYRNASLKQYQESGVVVAYKRLAKRDDRVCVGCLFTDGMLVEDLDHFDEHNQGRCTLIPVVRGAEGASEFETGKEWFLRQDEATQRSILGAGRYDAWINGGASLDDMATLTTDPTWGGAWVPTTVGNLQ